MARKRRFKVIGRVLLFGNAVLPLGGVRKNPDRSGGKPESARRFCHALRSEAGGAFDVSTRRDVKSPAYPNTFTPKHFSPKSFAFLKSL